MILSSTVNFHTFPLCTATVFPLCDAQRGNSSSRQQHTPNIKQLLCQYFILPSNFSLICFHRMNLYLPLICNNKKKKGTKYGFSRQSWSPTKTAESVRLVKQPQSSNMTSFPLTRETGLTDRWTDGWTDSLLGSLQIPVEPDLRASGIKTRLCKKL